MSDSLPTAYCATGRKDASALLLVLKDEPVAGVIESALIEGPDVILVSPQADLSGPVKLEPVPRSRLEAMARLRHWPVPPSPLVLTAVI